LALFRNSREGRLLASSCLSDCPFTSPSVRQCVCPSVRPSARNNSALIRRNSITFYTSTCDFTNTFGHIRPIPILVQFGQKFQIRYLKNYAPFNISAVFVFVKEAGCALCGGRAEAKNIFNITETEFSVTCGLRMKQLILWHRVLSIVIFEISAFKTCLFQFLHLRHLNFN
jgi:hypothetical protein